MEASLWASPPRHPSIEEPVMMMVMMKMMIVMMSFLWGILKRGGYRQAIGGLQEALGNPRRHMSTTPPKHL